MPHKQLVTFYLSMPQMLSISAEYTDEQFAMMLQWLRQPIGPYHVKDHSGAEWFITTPSNILVIKMGGYV